MFFILSQRKTQKYSILFVFLELFKAKRGGGRGHESIVKDVIQYFFIYKNYCLLLGLLLIFFFSLKSIFVLLLFQQTNNNNLIMTIYIEYIFLFFV